VFCMGFEAGGVKTSGLACVCSQYTLFQQKTLPIAYISGQSGEGKNCISFFCHFDVDFDPTLVSGHNGNHRIGLAILRIMIAIPINLYTSPAS